MTRTLSAREFRAHLAETLTSAETGDATVITRNGREIAAVVPITAVHRLQQLEETELLRIVHERMASDEPGIPLEQVMAEVLAEDA